LENHRPSRGLGGGPKGIQTNAAFAAEGYLGDIGVPPDPAPMDFNAWMEAYIGGRWYTFDPRHNARRMGRILISCGRDAADIPMIATLGPHKLTKFKVITEEVVEDTALAA
jgi:transglutaminase-like putative cysteine protease